ncbi:hypothetical protein [Shewanella saliphila]|uniref:Uncharacterized protein n=1 Tax=Shewanella saliphila TaxID=2282698 RepID=A0ABQ2QAR2_9GAMM|nr:hypothetical protein [Shewanella saliphila]MCL1099726.1 hypothetical protein [Shewanella saliphila]GGP62983.1 hypothetical protein GCM10009409_30830 [Shewanella saliphila]
MDKFVETLNYLERNDNLSSIDESSTEIRVEIFKELYENGLVNAIDCCSKTGLSYLEPRINMSGRQWLIEQTTSKTIQHSVSSEDIIDLKPNFMGLGINFNALFRRFRRK